MTFPKFFSLKFFNLKSSITPLCHAALLGGLALCAQGARAENNDHRIVNLQAEAVREVANDEMQATLYSEVNDKDATVLANKITRIINDAIVTSKQYPNVKIKTGNQNTYPIYDDKQRLQSWRGRAEIVLTSQDFKQTSQLVAQLQNSLRLENIRFNVSEQQRKKVENELMVEASKNFQQRAQLLLAPWNATKYELVNLQINTNNGGGYNRPMPVMTMATAKGADNQMEAQNYQGGESEVRVIANGSIQLQ